MPHFLRYVAAVLCLVFIANVADAQVRVRGYTRKDGTYVRPHYRSSPDGNFYNNWSTVGNVNPYTGKPGTKTAPPPKYGAPVYVQGYVRSDGVYVAPHWRTAPDGDLSNNYRSTTARVSSSAATTAVAHTSDASSATSIWSLKSGRNAADHPIAGNRAGNRDGGLALSSPVQEREGRVDEYRRAGQANVLATLGVSVDWRGYTTNELSDMDRRVREAQALADLGQAVDWRDYSWSQLQSMKMRIKAAGQLAHVGAEVDWNKYTWGELNDMKGRMELAESLRLKGVNVKWNDYHWSKLYEMNRKLANAK